MKYITRAGAISQKMCIKKKKYELYGYKNTRSFIYIDDAIDAANKKCDDHNEYNEIVIIGGGYLFRDTLKITNKLVLTNVNCEIEGDVFYPDIDFNEWQEKSSENFSKDIDNDYDFKGRVLERV